LVKVAGLIMAKLIFSLENRVLNEYQLNSERTVIGRRPTNDIQIDNLTVSGEHAVIVKKGNDFYIEDLASTNGTAVNSELVNNHLLQTGDLITFGKYQLKFITDTKPHVQNKPEDAFKNPIMVRHDESKFMTRMPEQIRSDKTLTNDSSLVKTSRVIDSKNETINPPAAIGKVQVLNGSSVGRELVLNKALTTLGKVGVQVAVITKRPHGYFIAHVEGKVFPIINGVSSGAQALALNDHDVIELAGVKMEFYLDKTLR
jgi:pSer/pThr/pTyr-binding forkhead associated (FHA) protein